MEAGDESPFKKGEAAASLHSQMTNVVNVDEIIFKKFTQETTYQSHLNLLERHVRCTQENYFNLKEEELAIQIERNERARKAKQQEIVLAKLNAHESEMKEFADNLLKRRSHLGEVIKSNLETINVKAEEIADSRYHLTKYNDLKQQLSGSFRQGQILESNGQALQLENKRKEISSQDELAKLKDQMAIDHGSELKEKDNRLPEEYEKRYNVSKSLEQSTFEMGEQFFISIEENEKEVAVIANEIESEKGQICEYQENNRQLEIDSTNKNIGILAQSNKIASPKETIKVELNSLSKLMSEIKRLAIQSTTDSKEIESIQKENDVLKAQKIQMNELLQNAKKKDVKKEKLQNLKAELKDLKSSSTNALKLLKADIEKKQSKISEIKQEIVAKENKAKPKVNEKKEDKLKKITDRFFNSNVIMYPTHRRKHSGVVAETDTKKKKKNNENVISSTTSISK